MLSEIFRNTRFALAFWRLVKQFQSGGLVRPRPSLCIGPRLAMIHHALRNFRKHARGVTILATYQKVRKRGARSAWPPALDRLAGAMVHHAFRNFPIHALCVNILAACQTIPQRGFVQPRSPLCIGPRRSMIHYALRSFRNTRGP